MSICHQSLTLFFSLSLSLSRFASITPSTSSINQVVNFLNEGEEILPDSLTLAPFWQRLLEHRHVFHLPMPNIFYPDGDETLIKAPSHMVGGGGRDESVGACRVSPHPSVSGRLYFSSSAALILLTCDAWWIMILCIYKNHRELLLRMVPTYIFGMLKH